MPRVYDGWVLSIQDGEPLPATIEQTPFNIETQRGELTFDASEFEPHTIPVQNFGVQLRVAEVATYSDWLFNLSPGVPMDTQCFIEVYFPADIAVDFNTFIPQQMFKPPSQPNGLPTTLGPEILSQVQDRQVMFWEGCSEAQSLGVEPSGLMTLFSLRTPTQLKPSASFEINIWKDEAKTQKIAQLETGAKVRVD